MDDDQETELRNPFPSPPSHYTRYTTSNLKLLALLKERAENADLSEVSQHEVLSDQNDVPEWPLTELEKLRADWMLEEGSYTVFGDTWLIKEPLVSLGDVGGNQLYPSDPSADRRPALRSILRSMLATYSNLLSALLLPPSTGSPTEPPEWRRHADWIGTLAQNLMAAANDLRPIQARASLELMMKRQLELRREETKALHTKCDDLEAKLAELRASARPPTNLLKHEDTEEALVHSKMDQLQSPKSPKVTMEDVLRWAEEIG